MIIFINGAINSGKSTVAKLLSEKISNPAIVEIDSLRDFISWMPIDKAVPINLENAVSVIRNFAKRNFNIIVPYPLSNKNYDYLMDELKDYSSEILIFTLNPKMEEIMKNNRGRKLNDWEKERIKYHYSIKINNPESGVIIDNTKQTQEETVNIILNNLKNKS
jgi:cytidylate kinase